MTLDTGKHIKPRLRQLLFEESIIARSGAQVTVPLDIVLVYRLYTLSRVIEIPSFL